MIKLLILLTTSLLPLSTFAAQGEDTCAANCHLIQPYHQGASSKPYLLSYKHQTDWQITCNECHNRSEQELIHDKQAYASGAYEQPFYPQDFGNQFCFECHQEYEGLIERTADYEKKQLINPHRIHNTRTECASCHKVHRRSRFTCSECHKEEWNKILPGWQIAE